MITYENETIIFSWNEEREFHIYDLDKVFKTHNKKDWAVRIGTERNENGRIDWEYWVDNEPLTVMAFLVVAENIGAFQ